MDLSGQLHTPATLPRGKNTQYPLDRRLGGFQSLSGCTGKEKKIPIPNDAYSPSNISVYMVRL
jgi:hypothetical protein